MAYYRKTVKAHSHLRCKYKENSEGQGYNKRDGDGRPKILNFRST
jgi:hypothetical protein